MVFVGVKDWILAIILHQNPNYPILHPYRLDNGRLVKKNYLLPRPLLPIGLCKICCKSLLITVITPTDWIMGL